MIIAREGTQMRELKFDDIVKLSEEQLQRAVVRFNDYDPSDRKRKPIDEWLFNDKEKSLDWTYHRNHVFNDGEILISFFRINDNDSSYLLVGIDEIHGTKDELCKANCPLDRKNVSHLTDFEQYIGKVIVTYKNKVRGGSFSYQHVKKGKIFPQLFVKTVLSEQYTMESFTGYSNIDLSFEKLQYICTNPHAPLDWKTSLSNEMGIYLITDTAKKMFYVGSAYGQEKLYQRWRTYALTYHGNNKKLKELFDEKGADYFKENMRFSILEHWDSESINNINYAIERENVWKNRLMARDGNVGYNKN